jgi:hypothetical protein
MDERFVRKLRQEPACPQLQCPIERPNRFVGASVALLRSPDVDFILKSEDVNFRARNREPIAGQLTHKHRGPVTRFAVRLKY